MSEKFNILKNEYSNCEKCPELVKDRIQTVFGSGNSKSKILFLGEAPGATEEKKGVPFCGMSGQILNQLLDSVGLSREDIFITNTILCRPPKNRNPTKDELENCSDRLHTLLQIMKPGVIVTIGNFATKQILGKIGITTIRGKIYKKKIAGIEVSIVPVVHPAAYLYSGRNPHIFAQMSRDFETIAKIVGKKPKFLNEF
jgi:uracil-DNA glycosylase